MTTIYRAGGVKSDTPAGFRSGWVANINDVRTVLKDNQGADFKVSPGKTFYIGKIYFQGTGGSFFILAYDDDGAGTNEVILLVSTQYEWVSPCYAPAQEYDCVIPVPAGKYITCRSSGASGFIFVMLFGQEV